MDKKFRGTWKICPPVLGLLNLHFSPTVTALPAEEIKSNSSQIILKIIK